ncbi:hypothetical protein B0H11DRAFT_1930510 [Mycena galericulata]|nr:hypothetical protein B0H11DRAFT_1930510 [Mycena galericulata]
MWALNWVELKWKWEESWNLEQGNGTQNTMIRITDMPARSSDPRPSPRFAKKARPKSLCALKKRGRHTREHGRDRGPEERVRCEDGCLVVHGGDAVEDALEDEVDAGQVERCVNEYEGKGLKPEVYYGVCDKGLRLDFASANGTDSASALEKMDDFASPAFQPRQDVAHGPSVMRFGFGNPAQKNNRRHWPVNFAAPLTPQAALPVWKPSAKEDVQGREIVKWVKEHLYPRYHEALDENGKLKNSTLSKKEYINEHLFPLVDAEYQITGKYVLQAFKELYKGRIQATKSLSPTPESGPSRTREVSAVDMFKKNNAAVTALTRGNLAKDGVKPQGQAWLLEFHKVGNELFEKCSEEVKTDWAAKAVAENERKRAGASAEEIAQQVAENQTNIIALAANRLVSLIGMGPNQVGPAVFHLSAAYKDAEGKVHERTASIGARSSGFKPTAAHQQTFKEWAKNVLYMVVQVDDDGQVYLPETDTKGLAKREIVAMLYSYFDPPKGSKILVPITRGSELTMVDIREAERDELRAYYDCALACQKKGEPLEHTVVPGDSTAEITDDNAGTGGNKPAETPAANKPAATPAINKPADTPPADKPAAADKPADTPAATSKPADTLVDEEEWDLTPPPPTPPPDFSSNLVQGLDEDGDEILPIVPPAARGSKGRGGGRGGRARGGKRGGRGIANTRGKATKARGGHGRAGAGAGAGEDRAGGTLEEEAGGRLKRKATDVASTADAPNPKKQKVMVEPRVTRSRAPPPPPPPSPPKGRTVPGSVGYLYLSSPSP